MSECKEHDGLRSTETDCPWCRVVSVEQENKTLHEQVAALESREVCNAAHDDVDECGYCQRDRALLQLDSIRKAWKIMRELTYHPPPEPEVAEQAIIEIENALK